MTREQREKHRRDQEFDEMLESTDPRHPKNNRRSEKGVNETPGPEGQVD